MARLRTIAVNCLVTSALILAADFSITHSSLIYSLVPNSFRIRDPNIRNTLARNVANGVGLWGKAYPVRTNSVGFRDAGAREVKKTSDKPMRVLFIGDSFTEGVGLAWEETFVGLFQARFPNIEVLNAAVAGYSPSMYWKKIERFLDEGYKVDHVIVYIDISDVQDEALTQFDAFGNIHDTEFLVDSFARIDDPPGTIQVRLPPGIAATTAFEDFWHANFRVSRYWGREAVRYLAQYFGGKAAEAPDREVSRLVRSMWTVAGVALPEGYGDLGVQGAIRKEIWAMDELAKILRARGIKFSIGVYPWPDQIAFDVVESRQVVIWRSWCETNECTKFIDSFPDFFAFKDDPNWRKKFYLDKDVHFNATGNRLLAQRLIAETKDIFGGD